MNIDSTLGTSPAARALAEQIGLAAGSDSPVLLRGESGTGKEQLARAIHAGSLRGAGPLVATGCLTRPEAQLEVDLFGCERGTVPGVTADRIGLLEAADGGTLFIEELSEVPPWLQARLLRALEDREFRRVGGARPLSVDFRLICATNRDVRKLVSSGVLRRDLYFRVQVLEIEAPPLRQRREDIPLLVEEALRTFAARSGRAEVRVAPEAGDWLRRHLWPGNVRELRNVLERAAVTAQDGEIRLQDVARDVRPAAGPPAAQIERRPRKDLSEEKELIEAALRDTCGNRSRAAMLLGISRITLWKKMRRLGMAPVTADRSAS